MTEQQSMISTFILAPAKAATNIDALSVSSPTEALNILRIGTSAIATLGSLYKDRVASRAAKVILSTLRALQSGSFRIPVIHSSPLPTSIPA